MQNLREPNWQSYHFLAENMPSCLHVWMLHAGSFMQHLKSVGVRKPRVQVVCQYWGLPSLDEKRQLSLPARTYALIREVLIESEGKRWMFARTVFPRSTLTGKQKQLARLKTRSLGSILFKDPDWQRSEFEFAKIDCTTEWHRHINQPTLITNAAVWARRSRFALQNKYLLLTEIFLPDMETL